MSATVFRKIKFALRGGWQLAGIALLFPGLAHATPQRPAVNPAPVPQQNVAESPEAIAQILLERETAGIAGRAEITIGQIDPRVMLAPCNRIEPFMPPGSRAWGRLNIGMRCRDGAVAGAGAGAGALPGANWTVFIPVTVKVFGPALVAAKSLMSGTAPNEGELETVDSELTREAGTPVTDIRQIEGRVLARSIFPGQVLRLEYFRAAPAIIQGDQVKLVAFGSGFTITTDGEALSQALDGQSVRVRTDVGRIVSGTARAGRVVELRY